MQIEKKCSKCGVNKALDLFHADKRSKDGKRSSCALCCTKYYETIKTRKAETNRNWYNANRCRHAELMQQWRRDNADHRADFDRNYRRDNRERYVKLAAKWAGENPEKRTLYRQRRRAMKHALPATLTLTEFESIPYVCGLTGVNEDLHFDHFIPLSIGHCGTTYENMIYLHDAINIAKGDSNPFEFFEQNGEYLGISSLSFFTVVSDLASRNGMTSSEYREFTYWCFDHKRTLIQAESDKRHSRDIWIEQNSN